MNRPHQSRGAVFFRSFAAAIALTGAMFALCGLLLERQEPPAEVSSPIEVRLPGREARLTVLVTGSEEPDGAPEFCALIGFLPDRAAIAVCVLPMETRWQANGGEGTLAAAWRMGKSSYLQKQLAAWLGIPIDRTLHQSYEDLAAVFTTCGPLPYRLTEECAGTVHGREVLFPTGDYTLDARAFCDLLALNAPADLARRSDRRAELLRALLSYHLPAVLTESGDTLWQNLLNHSQSDLSLLDYKERAAAAKTLAAREGNPVSCIYPDGTAGGAGYIFSDVTLACIRGTFGAE